MAQDSGAFKTIPTRWRRVPPLVIVGSAVAAEPHRPKNAFFDTAAAACASEFTNVCESIAVFSIQPDSQL
jgi:hypothetical protein